MTDKQSIQRRIRNARSGFDFLELAGSVPWVLGYLGVCVFLALAAVAAGAQPLELGSPFLDDMILQREMPVVVRGWAEPGSKVTVAFAGQTKRATANEKGKGNSPPFPQPYYNEWAARTESVEFSQWPKSLQEIATGLGAAAAGAGR